MGLRNPELCSWPGYGASVFSLFKHRTIKCMTLDIGAAKGIINQMMYHVGRPEF